MIPYHERIAFLREDLRQRERERDKAQAEVRFWVSTVEDAEKDIKQLMGTIAMYERRARAETTGDDMFAEHDANGTGDGAVSGAAQPHTPRSSHSENTKSSKLDHEAVYSAVLDSYNEEPYARAVSDHEGYFETRGLNASRDQIRRAINRGLAEGRLVKLSYGDSRRYIWYVLREMVEDVDGKLELSSSDFMPHVSLTDPSLLELTFEMEDEMDQQY